MNQNSLRILFSTVQIVVASSLHESRSLIICKKKIQSDKSPLIVKLSPIDEEHQWRESTSKIHLFAL